MPVREEPRSRKVVIDQCSGSVPTAQVLVPEGEAKDLLEASAADSVEVGPFQVRAFTIELYVIS